MTTTPKEREHLKFSKVVRVGTPKTHGILEQKNLKYYEKLDGTNSSFRLEDEEMVVGSKNRILDTSSDGDNRGFCKWVLKNIDKDILVEGLQFYGEWLVPHTVKYNEENYKKFYLFDVLDVESGLYLDETVVKEWADRLGVIYLEPLYVGKYKGGTHLKEIAQQKSQLGENQMEGLVIKDYEFRNRYGLQVFAKYVNEDFCEAHKGKPVKMNLETFDVENAIIERFITKARVRKAIERGVELGSENTGDMKMMGFVPKITLDDVFLEEGYTIATEYDIVNFKMIRKLAPRQVAKLLKELIEESL